MSETNQKVPDLSDISEVMLPVSHLQVVDIIDGIGMNAEITQIELLDANRASPLVDENHNSCNTELEDTTISNAVSEEYNRDTEIEQDKQEEEKDKKKKEEKETEPRAAVQTATPEPRNEGRDDENLDLQGGHEEEGITAAEETKVEYKENGQEEKEGGETVEAQQEIESDKSSDKCFEKEEKEHGEQEEDKQNESDDLQLSEHVVQLHETQESNKEGEVEEDEEEMCPEEYQDKNDSQEFPSDNPDCNTDMESPAICKELSGAGRKPDIIRQSYPNRYNTVSYRKIRKGNTKQRIDEFESMMHV
ncbi:ermin [Protopterus annectens]|uniref:ermin n=1 Tax=Protopterus annectens TaxID=7888 RepID=UPI001CF9B184|nr:ermin [Protopterus annectens]